MELDLLTQVTAFLVLGMWILFPWTILFSMFSRRVFLGSIIVCVLWGGFFALLGGLMALLTAFAAIGVFYCSWRFKFVGAFRRQAVLLLAMCVYDFCYFSLSANSGLMRDTLCAVLFLGYGVTEAYILLSPFLARASRPGEVFGLPRGSKEGAARRREFLGINSGRRFSVRVK